MILKDQASIIMSNLNNIAQDLFVSTDDSRYDIQFYVTDNFQKFNNITKLENKDYIPTILTRFDPFVPKSGNGLIVDYLEVKFYSDFKNREAVEEIVKRYQEDFHSIPQLDGTVSYTQYVGNYIYNEDERSSDGLNTRKFTATFRMEWDLVLSGVSYDNTTLTIGGVVMPVKIQTYRNDKATVANKPYNDASNINPNLISESLIVTLPLNTVTAGSALWQDIHTRSYNKTYTIVDNYGIGGIMTKEWELKSGIVNKEENKIVSFTVIFDIPLPRATITITHKPLVGLETIGSIIVTNFIDSSSNSLDGRTKEQVVKGREVRQVNGYSLSFLYDSANEMAKILAERSHKKVNGDRFDIIYEFEDLTFTLSDLVIEKGSHSFNDNPGVTFTITFAEGV